MTSDSTKDFGPIRDDYAFFQQHSNEAAADRQAYLEELRPWLRRTGQSFSLLDFGCGDGGFTADWLAAARISPTSLRLSLVEPNDAWRRAAADRVQRFSDHLIVAWPALPADLDARFDVVLSNHVFYYVPQLEAALRSLLNSLADDGVLVTAIGGSRNALIGVWYRAFEILDLPVPYNLSEALEAVLGSLGVSYQKRDVWYDLVFDDTEENRLAILRFLLGDYLAKVPLREMLDTFEPFVDERKIVMRIVHEHFLIRRGGGA